ncbi:SKA complex subunit 2 isoform 2-T2 [Anableps anableps]
MEPTVEKLETMFLKSEADLEYIERRLKLDFISSASENECSAKENVTVILNNLKSIKDKHSVLRSEVSKITDAQKESMVFIRNRLSRAMELIKLCHQASDLELTCLVSSLSCILSVISHWFSIY